MSTPTRVILNPQSIRDARTVAERLVRSLNLRVSTTSEKAEGWLRTFVWTGSEADSIRVVELLRSRHIRAQYAVVHDCAGQAPADYVIINWRKL